MESVFISSLYAEEVRIAPTEVMKSDVPENVIRLSGK